MQHFAYTLPYPSSSIFADFHLQAAIASFQSPVASFQGKENLLEGLRDLRGSRKVNSLQQ
jgi:hypothetical protein